MQPTNLVDVVLGNPVLFGVLVVALLAIGAWQRTLTYREYRLAHGIKSQVFILANGWATKRGRPLIREKAMPEQSAEYVTTVSQDDIGVWDVYNLLRDDGFSPHLLATTKARTNDGVRETSAAQLVYVHDDGKQTEAYLFATTDGVDVYAHVETVVYDPVGHVTDRQQAGDVRGVVRMALGEPLEAET